MGRNKQAVYLLIRIVGERKNDPFRAGSTVARPHLNAPDNAISTRCGGNRDAIALRLVAFNCREQIHSRLVLAHAHGVQRMGALGQTSEPAG